MAVHCNFYLCNSAPNTVFKDNRLLNVTSYTADLYEDTDVLNPSLKMVWNDNYATMFNYVYIQEFKRFYFIKKITAETGGAARIDCHVDVLYTYSRPLANCELYVTREGKEGKPTDIRDSQFPLKATKKIIPYRLASTFFNLNSADRSSRNFVVNLIGRDDAIGG